MSEHTSLEILENPIINTTFKNYL